MESNTLTYILMSLCFIMILGMIIYVSLDTKKMNKECKILEREVQELKQKNHENSFNSNYPSYLD